MKTCVKCGKTGKKLWLSKSGYCEKCAAEVLRTSKPKVKIATKQVLLLLAAGLFFLSSMTFLLNGKFGEFFTGLMIAGLFGFFCYRSIKKQDAGGQAQSVQKAKDSPALTQAATTSRTPEPQRKVFLPPSIEGYEPRYEYKDVRIAGYGHYSTAPLVPGTTADFVEEPDNEYDPRAVAVYVNGEKYGHVHKGTLLDMVHDFRKKGLPVGVRISSIEEDGPRLIVGYYDVPEYERLIQSGRDYKTFTLSGNTNEDMQGNIGCCSEGDAVEAIYDYEKERYSASSGCDIGWFPKSASTILESEHKAFIHQIEITDNEKYRVIVAVFEG